jgi:uncharacterized membrane protein
VTHSNLGGGYMRVIKTKEAFIETLSFYLSCKCTAEETKSIVDDYEELFANNLEAGETEESICLGLGNPKAIVQNYCREINKKSNLLLDFIHNPIMISCSIYLLCCLVSFWLMNKCSMRAINFFVVGIVGNIIIAAIFFAMITAGLEYSKGSICEFRRFFYALTVTCIILIGVECLVVPSWSNVTSGFVFSVLLALISFIFAIYFFVLSRKILNKNIIYCGTYLLISFVLHCCYVMNQLHMRTDDVLSFRIAMIKGVVYIAITGIIFYLLNRKAKIKWIHN